MTRRAVLAPLCLASFGAAFWAPIAPAQAGEPIPSSGTIDEQVHSVEVELERDGATVRVTRSLLNPGPFHARVDLPIPLPCEATLDDFQVEQLGPDGSSSWKPAELLDPGDASERFDDYYFGAVTSDELAFNSDTAMLLGRDDGWRCDADLSIWPIPPFQQRSVSYRVFVPSVYGEGRYTIELPQLDGYGLTPSIEVVALRDAEVEATIGTTELSAGTTLDGARGHTIVLSPRDPGRGRVRVVDLDVDALVASTPVAAAKLAADSDPLPRIVEAELAAPAELAKLPPVRRAVLLIDASRSVSAHDREQLQDLGAAYFEALAETDARVEIVLFDREVRRIYHDFVPAAWGAEDLPKLDIDARNGSEVGEAVSQARALLAEPSAVEGADWILVLSDLYLRSDFDVSAQQQAAASSAVRMHVIREGSSSVDFGPATADDPWTAVARAAGGMAWDSDGGSLWAAELVSPRTIWGLGLELELADGSHRSEPLDRWLAAGQRRAWSDYDHAGAALVRAGFVGEVWGQRRAWTASPDPLAGTRSAAALATSDPNDLLSAGARTALAFHARVISPFSSAWALAEFEGAARPPTHGFGIGGCHGSSSGSSTRCGGAHTVHAAHSSPLGFDVLVAQALGECRLSGHGHGSFETTDLEIVAVSSSNRCVTRQLWATDIEPTESRGRKQIEFAFENGRVIRVEVATL